MRIVGLFCEDVRPEVGGSETIVGVLPDNIAVPSTPGSLQRLVLYIRLQMSLDEKPGSLRLLMKLPHGETVDFGDDNRAVLDESIAAARKQELPIAGVIIRVSMGTIHVKAFGVIQAVAVVDGEEQIIAILNVKKSDPPNASEQPS